MEARCSLPLIEVFGRRPGRFNLINEGLSKCGVTGDFDICEIACGNGLAACHIAREYRCHVDGFDISDRRLEECIINSKEQQVEEITDFIKLDVINENIDKKYDVIICEAFFSSVSEKDKELFCRKLCGMLRDNGYIIICDFIVKGTASEDPREQVKNIPCFTGIKKMETYKALFEGTGLKTVLARDKSFELYKMVKFLANSYGVETDGLGEVFARIESVNEKIKLPQKISFKRVSATTNNNNIDKESVKIKNTEISDSMQDKIKEKEEKIKNFFGRTQIGYGLLLFQKCN